MRAGVFAVVAFVAVVLDVTVAPEIAIWGARPDFAVLALVYGSLVLGGRAATIAGFSMGLLIDTGNPEYLGLNALALAVVGYATGGVWDHLVRTNVLVQCVVIFGATMLHDFIYYLIYYRNHLDFFADSMLSQGVVGAAYTAAFGLVIFAVARLSGWRAIADGSQG